MDSRLNGVELLTAEQMQTIIGGGWSIIWEDPEDPRIPPYEKK
ncbi:MAG: hypothetical protein NZ481_08325 [Candidatus Kapabacteria bacterium]|nr:hypothetical protein [Candidatus Kapabacteria bacterium]